MDFKHKWNPDKTLVVMRGLPGSGKSYAAQVHGGLILSTDDYFVVDGEYQFNPTLIGEAHAWNQKRASYAMEDKVPVIVVDNTNIRLWEMKPYVLLAQKHGYRPVFCYPETEWATNPEECARRNSHGVPFEAIERMNQNFEQFRSIAEILKSERPEFKPV
jgi:NEDD4-binding protein 2